MSTNDEKQKQAEVKAGAECDHVGYNVGFGFEVITVPNGTLLCLTAQNCMMCGQTFIKATTLGTPQDPEAKKNNSTIIVPN